MDSWDMLYTLSALPLVAMAIRCWARWARGAGGRGWLALGVVLAALGLDGLRQLLRRAEMAPTIWAGPTVVMFCGGFLLYVVLRTYRDLGRKRRRPPSLEELVGRSER